MRTDGVTDSVAKVDTGVPKADTGKGSSQSIRRILGSGSHTRRGIVKMHVQHLRQRFIIVRILRDPRKMLDGRIQRPH